MGIIKAAVQSVKGGLADQWLEVIQPRTMGDTTVMTTGVSVRRDKKHQNKGREDHMPDQVTRSIYIQGSHASAWK